MIDIFQINYSVLDRPEVIHFLFHPRPEMGDGSNTGPGRDVMIPVEENIRVGGRFHIANTSSPNILFFHGNGEIVSDYDDLGPIYTRLGINFLPVDYRGYGRSDGIPTVTAMMRDSHVILDFTRDRLRSEGCTGPLILMGRSLGSASVLELVSHYPDAVDGLIVESGFAYAAPLLELLGIDIRAIGFEEKEGFRNLDKIAAFSGPTLIIHALNDHIIPFSDGEALYNAGSASDKTLLKIPGANHNDLMHVGFSEYMRAVKHLTDTVSG